MSSPKNAPPRIAALSVFRSLPRSTIAASLGVSLLVVLAALSPTVARAWEFDRDALAQGELWRLVTGHLTHWNFDHLFWDLATFLGLSLVCLQRSLRSTLACWFGSALAISLCIWQWQPDIILYRGLSGIDSALFALLAVGMLFDARRSQDRVVFRLTLFALVGLAGKIGYEVFTGQTLFVDSSAAGFVPLASAHAVGAIVGGLIAMLSNLDRTRLNLPRRSTWATTRADPARTNA